MLYFLQVSITWITIVIVYVHFREEGCSGFIEKDIEWQHYGTPNAAPDDTIEGTLKSIGCDTQ